MTSSTRLEQRLNSGLSFGVPWYDHYVRAQGKCHPDFDTILLTTNNQHPDGRGVKVCVRRPQSPESTNTQPPGFPFVHRYSWTMYEPSRVPIQRQNTFLRVPPNEVYGLLNDYQKISPFFNGTGLYVGKVCDNVHEYAYNG
jgi:hypothetical protein